MEYTDQQKQVISARNCDVLVSAGAGSGKTAVLTERIMSRILDPKQPVNVDRLLVLTFTRAAAAQMKQKLQDKMREYIKKHPTDQRMQLQESLLHNAQITTIDSFCQFLLRSHFHQAGIDPAFRIADNGEVLLLEQEALEQVLEEAFEKQEEDFLYLAAALNPNAREKELESSILLLSNYASSHPWPAKWLREQLVRDESEYLSNLQKRMAHQAYQDLSAMIDLLEILESASLNDAGAPAEYAETFRKDQEMLNAVREKILSATSVKEGETSLYEEVQSAFGLLAWDRIATIKKQNKELVEESVKERLKAERDRCKKTAGEIADQFAPSYEEFLAGEVLAKKLSDALLRVTIAFCDRLLTIKKERNVFDFSDIEHLALEVLYQDETETETAVVYRDFFEEVMVDEYQDSNEVQEILLSALARKADGAHNRFMVGDKKQSIYRFRMSRPEIFTEKYESFQGEDPNTELILLSHNFRSRSEVIDSVNGIFRRIMRKAIGGVEYDQMEELICSGSFTPVPEDQKTGNACRRDTELLLCESGDTGEEKRNLEFAAIAQRIKEMKGRFLVQDGQDGLRPMRYGDVVILLRSLKGTAGEMKEALEQVGIPAHGAVKGGFYEEREIVRLMDLLKCIQNPHYDLPLVSALMSEFFSLSEETLAQVRMGEKNCSFYTSLVNKAESDDSEVGEIAKRVVDEIGRLRKLAGYMTVTELVREILSQFHYRETLLAMPAGEQRCANVDLFLQKTADFEQSGFHGLFQFIRYMEKLAEREASEGQPDTLSESADVVRIMSIHASKGLEFPVVFLAACDKAFNMSDQRKTFLMDLTEGVASDWIDTDRRIKGKSQRKELLKRRSQRESFGEEMRLLYVAATRAKEKLIFTATAKDADQKSESYAYLSQENLKDGTVPVSLLERTSNYLDELLMAYRLDPKVFTLRTVYPEDVDNNVLLGNAALADRKAVLDRLLDWEGQRRKYLEKEADSEETALYEQMRERFAFTYPHMNLEGLYAKTSVSELKHAAMEEEGVRTEFETDRSQRHYVPAFAEETQQLGGTRRGTAYHRVMELLDIEGCVGMTVAGTGEEEITASLQEQIGRMVKAYKIEEEDAGLVSVKKLLPFFSSGCAGRMAAAQKAGKLYREQPFIINIEADLVNRDVPKEERVMIQGVIDVFWEEDGKLVLLDYKTDRVDSMKELSERYHMQLQYYKRALEQATGKEVAACILYSFHLDQEGSIDLSV